ncbi:MAG: RuBisCO large subunit C-terminal-like domain-containing protein [Anaerostipes sp.]|jgi:2,3-diketo-5-methylthiopentyl-1-phosphate enolase|nr:RuBisCO large subunit C-terminal-like domain-containing protein [Anaerostipes sp.]MDD3745999.1 RuBisCO large subunit C-terminal-like domain-containing protein [Anaerostipes sp.]
MKFETMRLPESVDDNFIIATYYMKSETEPDLYAWVKLVAGDQSAGTWTHVEGETPEVIEKYGGKVIGIYPMAEERACIARIAFPIANIPSYLPMIMSTVAGNILGQEGIRLVDVELPEKVLKELPGPLLGVEGIRDLIGVPERPLVGAILKPCIGVPPEVSAKGARGAALGGADVIKDDELLSYPEYSPMEDRVKAVMKELKEIGKEKTCLYAVNITGENLLERAKRAIDAGANSLMVNYQAMGWGAVEDFIRAMKRENLIYPIFGHCAGMGAYYRSKTQGIGTALSCGKLARLVGMDMPLVYPDSGRFGLSTNEFVETHAQCIAPMKNIKRSFMTVAGGVQPGAIEYLMDLLGNDCILMAGGGIYGHPMGAEAGAKAILHAIEAKMEGKTILEAAKECEALQAAVDVWGTRGH